MLSRPKVRFQDGQSYRPPGEDCDTLHAKGDLFGHRPYTLWNSLVVLHQPDDKTNYELAPLIRVLLGMSPPSKPSKLGDISFFDESLNPSQKAAVRFALEAMEVACIHGPPGTFCRYSAPSLPLQCTIKAQAKPTR